MWVDFQQAFLLVAGDGVWTIAIFTFAGGLLLGMLHIALGVFRRYL